MYHQRLIHYESHTMMGVVPLQWKPAYMPSDKYAISEESYHNVMRYGCSYGNVTRGINENPSSLKRGCP